ncbi:MAG: hypothetical protein HY042_10885 [Spirochaetia bacterium]|nr:hypothetical protein [Spirochaetia bacterium]
MIAEQILPVAEVVIPDLAADLAARAEFQVKFAELFEGVDPASQGKIRTFLSVLNLASIVRYLRPLKSLNPAQKEKLVVGFSRHRIKLFQSALAGVRSLVLLSYYATAHSWKRLEYEGPLVGGAGGSR